MSEQALDLKRSVRIVRRHWLVVTAVAVAGLVAGGAYAVLRPPVLTSTALVRIVAPPSAPSGNGSGSSGNGSGSSSNGTDTWVLIASSDDVLKLALPHIQPPVSMQTLRSELQVKSPAPDIISIRAEGRTAAQAGDAANAVATSFVGYLASPQSQSGSTRALVQQPATAATERSRAVSIAIFGVIGILAGGAIGAIGVLAVKRRDRRLRLRDEIADSIGIPVLASIQVGHPSDAAGWLRLLTGYEPGVVDAWRLRAALDFLGAGNAGPATMGQGQGISLAVLSLQSDPAALALGPQLAAFAASREIRTELVIGLQPDPGAAATLCAACTGVAETEYLRVSVGDQRRARHRPATLTFIVGVIDQNAPRGAGRMPATAAVLGVSAGTATAEELARAAISAADQGCKLVGILVADPDSTDGTTGRLPQLARTNSRMAPTHLTGIPTETRRWMTQIRQP
jgi:capsular polysaccharide biosynthesis protein